MRMRAFGLPRRGSRASPAGVAFATAIAWLGFLVHNVADLPGVPLLAPEYTDPTAIWVALLLVWWGASGRRWASVLLFGWGIVNVAGAIVSVLPLALLPFRPEQSLAHYGFHALYLALQLPLLVMLGPAVIGGGGRGGTSADRRPASRGTTAAGRPGPSRR